MADNNTLVDAALKPGEQTTEFKAAKQVTFWAKIMMAAGIVTAVVPQVVAAMQQTGIDQTKWGATTLSVLGIVMSVAGMIANGSVNSSYIASRGLVKAAAVRDVNLDANNVPKI